MLRVESNRAVQRYGEELQLLVDKCTSEMQAVRAAFHKGVLGTGSEAVEFSSTMQAEVEQLHSKVPLLVQISEETPRAGPMIRSSLEHLKAITSVFDRFESRVESAYGIPPVVVEKRSQGRVEGEMVGTMKIGAGGIMAGKEVGSGVGVGRVTPKAYVRREEEEKEEVFMPATPKMEDFGLCYDDLRELGMSGGGKGGGSRYGEGREGKFGGASVRGYQGVGGVDFGKGDYEENVHKSMCALGIETPVQVAEKFETRRHRALTSVMTTTTPKLKGGGLERTMDWTGLAGGYFERGEEDRGVGGGNMTHRQLNFDETPRRGGEEEMRRRIGEGWEGLDFWKKKVGREELQEAGMVLMREGKGVWAKAELNSILTREMTGGASSGIIFCLTRMGVLTLEKNMGEEAAYRLVGEGGI